MFSDPARSAMVRATFKMLLAHSPLTASTFAAASITGSGAEVQFV